MITENLVECSIEQMGRGVIFDRHFTCVCETAFKFCSALREKVLGVFHFSSKASCIDTHTFSRASSTVISTGKP